MNEPEQPMDWATFFASLSDEGLQRIADHLHREQFDRVYRQYKATLPRINEAEMALVNGNKYIEAIKEYRSRTRVDLREAKFAVDLYKFPKGHNGPQPG